LDQLYAAAEELGVPISELLPDEKVVLTDNVVLLPIDSGIARSSESQILAFVDKARLPGGLDNVDAELADLQGEDN